MYSYQEQLKTVKRYKVQEGLTQRFNCPFCDGYNTLGITNQNGIIQWHCFKSSCTVHGVYDSGMSIEGIKNKLNYKKEIDASMGREIPFLTDYHHDIECIKYLSSVNSLEAANQGLIDIKYAPSENRVLFHLPTPIYGTSKGYVGRRLNAYGPKWVKYGDTSSLFTCGNGEIGVIVEDAPSACAVGIIEDYTGISLLGTNLTPKHKIELINTFDRVYVCLDPDAATKSLKLAQQLEGFIKSSVKLIPDDLKWFSPDKIKEILKDF